MDVLKQAVSIPIFGSVIWLAWVRAQAYGAALLAALLMSFLLLAIAGWFLGRWPAKRWATVVAALILLAVVAMSVVRPRELASLPEPPAQLLSESAAARSAVGSHGRPMRVQKRARGRPAGVCGFHRELVPELPGERARGPGPA